MEDLTFQTLRENNLIRTNEVFHPLDSWSPTDWACALGGEVGEALNLVKKMRRGEDVDLTAIAYELADVVCYADLLASRLRIDLGVAVREKFNIVSDRKNSKVRI